MEMLQSLPLEALVPCIGSIHVCILEVIHIDLQNICIYIYIISYTRPFAKVLTMFKPPFHSRWDYSWEGIQFYIKLSQSNSELATTKVGFGFQVPILTYLTSAISKIYGKSPFPGCFP